ncbi:hypothetical protein [Gaiella sp.]
MVRVQPGELIVALIVLGKGLRTAMRGPNRLGFGARRATRDVL